MNRTRGSRALVALLIISLLTPALPARAAMERDPAKRLLLDPGNFPLIPSIGSAFGWALSTGLWDGLKAAAGSTAIGLPAAIGMQLLAQKAIDGHVDLTKAVASGVGSTVVPLLAMSLLGGPAAPLLYFGLSMAGSFAAQWAVDWWRDRRAQQAATPATPAAAPRGSLSLLGVGGSGLSR